MNVGIYALDPGTSTETREAGHVQQVITTPKVFFPTSTTFAARDRIVARAGTFEVEGETERWLHPNGVDQGHVATLRRVTG